MVVQSSVSVKPIEQTIQENKEIKVKKKLIRSQPYFWHHVSKIEAQAKKLFSYKKNVYSFCFNKIICFFSFGLKTVFHLCRISMSHLLLHRFYFLKNIF